MEANTGMESSTLNRNDLVEYLCNGFPMRGRVAHIGVSKKAHNLVWIRRLSRAGKGLIDCVQVSDIRAVLNYVAK